MTNALKVARIHLVNAPITLLMPWSVLGSAFLINLLVFGLASDIPADSRVTGALASIYIFALVANLQAVTQVFPFSAGLSRTRKAFWGGTALFVAGQSIVTGVLLTVLRLIEDATNGWGMSLTFFGLPFIVQDNLVLQVLVYSAPFMLMGALGLVIGTVFKRWGQLGMLTLTVASVLLFGGLAVLVTWREAWSQVWRFVTDTSPLMLTAGYPLLLTAVFGAISFGLLRRAVP
jgi:hypothetical protein